jgi:diguanylate cyclase (GGDEF)-like protein
MTLTGEDKVTDDAPDVGHGSPSSLCDAPRYSRATIEEAEPSARWRKFRDREKAPARRYIWGTIAAVLLAVGVAATFVAARGQASSSTDAKHDEFVTTSGEIATTLQLAIQHEEDLISGAGAQFITNPNLTQSQFSNWAADTTAFHRYPELVGMEEITMVPAAQLGAFETRILTDPPGAVGANDTYQVAPSGTRPYYCLGTAVLTRDPKLVPPAGLDYCTSIGSLLLGAVDSGKTAFIPYKTGGSEELGFGSAIYSSGTVPSTVAARRASFIGWMGMEVLPKTILVTALEHHPNAAVALSFGSGKSKVSFSDGKTAGRTDLVSINLHNGWTVKTFGPPLTSTIRSNSGAFALLVAGLLASLLLSAMVYLLGTGRARARAKLEERTGQLRFQALHDALTGLPNRALINDRTEQLVARCHRSGAPLAAMFIDLDDFKDVNDTLGHSAGDELLVAVAARLAAALREGDTVGRLGGDEFVLLVEGSPLIAGAQGVADRVLEVLRAPFHVRGSELPLTVGASIGIATDPNVSPEELLRNADIALYQAKAAGGGCAVVFDPLVQEAVHDRSILMRDLRSALEAEQLFLLYQPTIDLETDTFTGVEALLRWNHPERGVVQPNEFIPLMEATGVIIPVGAWVLEEACRQGAAWLEQGYFLKVSVNVSAKQLEQHRIVDDVRLALSVSGFDPSMLILEITETTLMANPTETVSRIEELKSLGVRIAIDDFGTGYSSLGYLKQFPIDILKIDRSFVTGISESFEAVALVRALVELGKILKLETIAEGIEDDDQRLRLQAEQVDTGQGFLFSRPVEPSVIEEFMIKADARADGSAHMRAVAPLPAV